MPRHLILSQQLTGGVVKIFLATSYFLLSQILLSENFSARFSDQNVYGSRGLIVDCSFTISSKLFYARYEFQRNDLIP